MTDQRDVAKEVERIAAGHRSTVIQGWGGEDVETLLAFIASQSRELEELRRPVVQSYAAAAIALGKEQLAILDAHGARSRAIEALISALDQAQRETNRINSLALEQRERLALTEAARDALSQRVADLETNLGTTIAQHNNTCDKFYHETCMLNEARKEIARLSSPPEERGEIVERQAQRRLWIESSSLGHPSTAFLTVGSLFEDTDTLLQDLRRYSNAHKILLAERDEARGKVERLEGALKLARKYAGCSRDCGGSEYRNGQRVACGCGFAEALPKIIAAATNSMVVTNENGRRSYVPLAAADGQQEAPCSGS